jgi:Ca2+-binding EF-hand superfamily protein
MFASFQKQDEDTISYIELAVGLSFLCLRSPLEERLMVAFTISDSDSDGFINFDEFVQLIHSTLLIISICSRIATKKILSLGTTLEELAYLSALEGIGALGIDQDDEISLEMLCDLAEDYLKLASLV